MKNILFPTDFSENSLNAFAYAMAYAQKLEATLIVYHSYHEDVLVDEKTQTIYDKIDIDNFRNKKDKFPPFEKLIKASKKGNLKVKYIVDQGVFVNSLFKYVAKRDDKIEIIIMGTQNTGNSSLFNIFMETDTIKILEELDKPVIAVPSRAKFDGELNDIMFLVDYRDEEIIPLEKLTKIAKEFKANLHVVHFDLAHGESITPLMDKFKGNINVNYNKTQFISIDSINLKKSLTTYCKDNKIDIVCLINQERNLYQRLFTFSLAEDLINHIDIPVMAIYIK
ncbi:universal stress protein [Polaribacter sp. Q13]|uniref:universal stress protein n=1 Tax=Polaribacter sp. Q13 TaxID=2806551 RepID=UPI00193AF46D|nr:universal stress protein [Polaribacter sp. Q13]QVY64832.1 universal stress protein [Polaribacter sp. Q13]